KSQRPLKVQKFAMAIRNYETFLKDSTYEMQFDSVLFNDDKIVLDDFLFRQLDKGKTVNSFKVPRFQLSGLSWNDLLLERKLTAEQATLYNPVIRYTERGAQNEKSINRNIFDILANMNDVIMLQDLNIINGNIGLSLNGGIEMNLQKATLSVESRSLLGSEQLSEIRRSVNYLDFKRGIIKINDVTVNLDDIRYTGTDSRLDAGKALITNESNTLLATAKGVILDKILINEKTGDVIIDGIAWKQAEINLASLFSRSRKRFNSFVNLTDIKGKDSKFVTTIGGKRLSANFSDLKAIAFLFHPGEKPIIEGLHLNGNSLSLTDSAFRLHIGTFAISDLQTASFENASFENVNHGDSISIRVPLITFVPDIESAVAGQFLWGEMTIHQPVIRIKAKESINRPNRGLLLIPGSIARLVILQPELLWSIQNENGAREIKWSGKKSATNSLVMLDVKTVDSAFSARQLLLSLNNFVYTNPGGKGFDEGQGTLTALINDFKYQETNPEEASWEGKLASLEGKNFLFDSLGSRKARLSIEYILLKDLAIKSSSLANIRNMISSNKKFRLQQFTGTYTDNIKHFAWYNAGYDKGTRSFTSDSMRYNPSVSKEKFDSLYPYQSDYIKISTGAIEIGPFDLDGYLSDSIMGFGSVKISETVLNDFRDNRLPFRSGIIKSLMVERLKKIPVKIAIDTLQFNNTNITYTEFNPRTNLPGVVHFNRANIKLFPVRNFNLGPTDSLRLHATGYLMDSIWTRLRLKQSYTDSLSGFLLTVRMKQADMQQLNPLFKSLAGAKLRSGYMDTLSMRVAGSEYLAYGEMKFLYRDLKVQLVDMETGKNRGLLTFLANNFLVRNKNIHRTSSVFFIRNRERSPLNYLVKLLTSGLLSGTGVKSNAKIIRQYKKELRQRNLPPLDYD
ncbi:MAG TPA: hypothetical protein VFO70_11910, partial [Chitinophagaceae bacterium]|nr:hypothetical protein [Chitinophagaceae bacterium]